MALGQFSTPEPAVDYPATYVDRLDDIVSALEDLRTIPNARPDLVFSVENGSDLPIVAWTPVQSGWSMLAPIVVLPDGKIRTPPASMPGQVVVRP